MKQIYLDAMDRLIHKVQAHRDFIIKNQLIQNFEEQTNPLIVLHDERFTTYKSLVETSEYHTAKAIESIAIELLKIRDITWNLYQSSPYNSLKFKIVINQNGKKIGVVFCPLSDASEHAGAFFDHKYAVDKLKIVILSDSKGFAKEVQTSQNSYNSHHNLGIEKIGILDFWTNYFGAEERNNLVDFFKLFNQRARNIIGFNTSIIPTNKALHDFRIKCEDEIINKIDYTLDDQNVINLAEIETINKNYFDRGLWRALISNKEFAISFITSEWYYKMDEMSENLDLTNVAVGYLKSIEQLLYAIIKLHDGTGITIRLKNNIKKSQENFIKDSNNKPRSNYIKFDKTNFDIIDTTLGSLNNVIDYNTRKNHKIFNVQTTTVQYISKVIKDWCDERNDPLHKEILRKKEKIDEIRKKAFHLYYLILGSCLIRDDQFAELGIEKND